jgi:hypothetical protein
LKFFFSERTVVPLPERQEEWAMESSPYITGEILHIDGGQTAGHQADGPGCPSGAWPVAARLRWRVALR